MKHDRRTFLRATGVMMALPLLEALAPKRARAAAAGAIPRRMVCINTPLGVHPPFFFPEKAGKDYELSPYLEVLKDLRELSVYGWQITDASLPVVRGFEKLEFLDLRSTNMKKASAEQLQKEMPKCRIFLP